MNNVDNMLNKKKQIISNLNKEKYLFIQLQSIYQTMMVKRRELEKVARQQQHKHEYDSDEETDNETGTWEHRIRTAEMDITRG